VIVGGGFGGLTCARALRRADARVTLIDRRNHHLFQPLLYQVATAALNPSDIAYPLRSVLRRQANATVLLAEAERVDVPAKKLVLADGELSYDVLVLATGATHSYFGKDAWAAHAPGLKTLEDALEIRRRVLLAFELAEREEDVERRRAQMTFIVVGAGPTGVELAGALAEIARHTLKRDFRRIDPRQARVILVEGAPRVLPPYPETLSEKAKEQLARLGVEVRLGAPVTEVDAQGVTLGPERIAARTILWAAGVRASSLGASLDGPRDRAGRIQVTPELTLPGRSEIFVIGDLASLRQDDKPVPGVAPAAIQMGRHTGANILRSLRGETLLPFRYKDKGLMATIGRGAAVAALGKLRFSGWIAWWLWLLVHILFLIGFRNRVLVLFGWAYAYLTWRRGARLITGESPHPPTSMSP
jgi:NADH dehydrogenase